MDPRKAEGLVGELLERTDLHEVLSSVLDQQRQPHITAHCSSSEELSQLFRPNRQTRSVQDSPRYFLRKNFGKWNDRKGTRSKTPASNAVYPIFNKDVILLNGPDNVTVVKQATKHILYERGHILSAFEFYKEWDSKTVEEKIRQAFGSKIPDDVSFQFLMPCGNKLVVTKLTENKELTALMIHKVYHQKTIYLQPSRKLMIDHLESDDVDADDNTVVDIPQNPRTPLLAFSSTNALESAYQTIDPLNHVFYESSITNLSSTAKNLLENETYISTSSLPSTSTENNTTAHGTSSSLSNVLSKTASSKECQSHYCPTFAPSSITIQNSNSIYEGAMEDAFTNDTTCEFPTIMSPSLLTSEPTEHINLSPNKIYSQYVECIGSDNESDMSDDMNLAIQASLEEHYNDIQKEEHSSQELLKELD